jgi:hypothetical protein
VVDWVCVSGVGGLVSHGSGEDGGRSRAGVGEEGRWG